MGARGFFNKAAKEIGDFHLKNRGMLGLTFGMVAGIGMSYTGFAQDLAWAITAHMVEPEKMTAPAAIGVANNILQSMAASMVLMSVAADVVVHKVRKGRLSPPPAPQNS